MIGYILRLAAKIATYLLALLTVVAAYGGYVPPVVWAFPSVLVLAYPYLALLTLVAGLAWLLSRSFVTAIICGAALLAGGGALFVNLPVSSSKMNAPGETPFKLLTYNVMHGIDARQPDFPRSRTMEYILHSGADIVCLQELYSLSDSETPHLSPQLVDSIRRVYPYELHTPQGSLTMLSKYPCRIIKTDKGSNWWNIFALYSVDIKGHALNVLNLHLAPYNLSSDERQVVTDITGVRSAGKSIKEFKGSILSKLKESFRQRAGEADIVRDVVNSAGSPLIVCGDFNDVPASWTYRTIKGDDLSDAYCDTGLGMMVTYNLHGFYFHIDQILYRGALRALSVTKGKINSSDHFPLLAEFAFSPAKK